MREGEPKLDMEGPKAAAAALNEMMSAEQCGLLVEAIINKYIVLSAEELQEWQAGPSFPLCGTGICKGCVPCAEVAFGCTARPGLKTYHAEFS